MLRAMAPLLTRHVHGWLRQGAGECRLEWVSVWEGILVTTVVGCLAVSCWRRPRQLPKREVQHHLWRLRQWRQWRQHFLRVVLRRRCTAVIMVCAAAG